MFRKLFLVTKHLQWTFILPADTCVRRGVYRRSVLGSGLGEEAAGRSLNLWSHLRSNVWKYSPFLRDTEYMCAPSYWLVKGKERLQQNKDHLLKGRVAPQAIKSSPHENPSSTRTTRDSHFYMVWSIKTPGRFSELPNILPLLLKCFKHVIILLCLRPRTLVPHPYFATYKLCDLGLVN